MLWKANCSGNLGRNCFDLFFPIQRLVNLQTKVACCFHYFKLIIAHFQFQNLILIVERVLVLLGTNKHGMAFRNIQGEFISLKPRVEFPEIVVNSLIQPGQVVGLVAQTGIISIHGYVRFLDSLWEIIDVNEKEKWTKTRSLGDPNLYILKCRINTVNPTELFTVR